MQTRVIPRRARHDLRCHRIAHRDPAAGVACTGRISGKGGGASPPTGTGTSGTGGSTTAGAAGSSMASGTGAAVTSGAGGSATGGTGVIGTGSGGSAPALDCSQPAPGPAPLRRLTRFEYSNTIRDLLGDATSPGDQLPPELKGNGFSNDATSLTTPRLLVDAYQSVAKDIAARATKDAATLLSTTKCDTTKRTEDACAQSFVTIWARARSDGRSMPRRAPRSSASTRRSVPQAPTPTPSPRSSRWCCSRRNSSTVPSSACRWRASRWPASPATRWRRASPTLLWGTMPDQMLLDAAKSGQLETKEQVQAQAMRMLDDPHAKDVSHFFHNTWLGINGLDGLQRDTTWFPTYTPELAALFRQETEQFVDYVVWKGKGDLATIFTAPFTFLNGTLSKFYGFGNVTDTSFQLVNTDGKQRAGMLTQASVLTATTPGTHNNPVVRGKFIYTQLLCGRCPIRRPRLMVKEPTPDPTRPCASCSWRTARTRRASLATRRSIQSASASRTTTASGSGKTPTTASPIDASGNIPDHDTAGAFNGAGRAGQEARGQPGRAELLRREVARRSLTAAARRRLTPATVPPCRPLFRRRTETSGSCCSRSRRPTHSSTARSRNKENSDDYVEEPNLAPDACCAARATSPSACRSSRRCCARAERTRPGPSRCGSSSSTRRAARCSTSGDRPAPRRTFTLERHDVAAQSVEGPAAVRRRTQPERHRKWASVIRTAVAWPAS